MVNLTDAQGIELNIGDNAVTVELVWNTKTAMKAGIVQDVNESSVTVKYANGYTSKHKRSPIKNLPQTTRVLKIKEI